MGGGSLTDILNQHETIKLEESVIAYVCLFRESNISSLGVFMCAKGSAVHA